MPKMPISHSAAKMPVSTNGNESNVAHTSDCLARRLASSKVRAPTACATNTALPTATALSAEITKNINCVAAPTPANAAVPKKATNHVSTMPSMVSRKFSPMTGQARLKTRRCKGSSSTGS